MVPVLNLSAFFLRLSKDTKPNFRITKYNATTLTVLVFGAFLAQSPIDKAAIVAEEKYRYVMNNNAAERIIEIYKGNRGFPYNFDDGGYLKVYQLEADYGTVEFKMKETEQDIFDWESEELNTWLTAELCGQQKIINENLAETINVFVKFELYSFAGQLVWGRDTRVDNC